TPLAGQTITIRWNNGSTYSLGPVVTNSSGYFDYYYNLSPATDTVGFTTVWAEFTTAVPLWDDTDSTPGVTFTVDKYGVTVDISVYLNPEYLNESVFLDVWVYFSHNFTVISGEWVSLWWQNSSTYLISNRQTDAFGFFSFEYSQMDEDTFLTPIMVYANFTGNTYLADSTSNIESLTLQRWQTLITGFDTGGITTFLLTDTIVVSGTLFYELFGPPDEPYAGAVVQILVDGFLVNTTTTAANGSFVGYWEIPDLTIVGNYDISVRYQSAVNWISDHETTPITVTINAITIIWTFEADPNVVYRSEWLNISGILDLNNGSAYAGASVTIIWENTVTTTGPRTIAIVTTDFNGRFEYWYKLSDTEDLGLTQLWAECVSGVPIIAASSSSIELLDVMQIPVVLLASGSHSLIYLDDTITINGTLQFANGTAMDGYSVEIIWDGNVLDTILIIDSVAGAYSYDYQLPWDDIPRDITYYVSFVRPSEAYFDADSTSEPLEIRDIITLLLDAQTVTSVLRGDTLFVSGSVTNGGGADAEVPIELLVDPSQAGIFAISDVNGLISIDFVIRDSYVPGIYNISIGVSSPYYDLTSSSGYWWIQVNITSDVSVAFENIPNVMPGESFTLSFTIADQDGDRHIGESVDIYLNDTFITTITIVDSSPNTHTILISPAQWTAGSGFFVAIVVYSGTQFVLGSSGQTTDSIHVFDEVAFTSFSPPYGVINTALTLEGVLVDSAGNPIEGRTITLTRNDSIPVDLTTNEDGLFSLVSTEQFMSEGQYTFRVSFSMADGSVIRDSWTFEVTSGLPPGFDTALLITWAVVVAIEAVIAMLIVARYRYRGRAFVFPRLGFTERASEIHDS
ncbi:MAG: carboxypeptidase regulatory-like domain-containing protein, partial [Candidatus Thorarchaeota archaeon]|nr:carboxypeptidase regulatory-like domain-containing protein [Candidatus Thorarchaeota archaeon]